MFDLKNREYEKVMAYIPNEAVVFKMKNGLAYRVSLGGRIFVDAVWWNFFKMSPYYEVGDKTPKDVLQKAVEILKTAEVPKLSEERARRYEEFLKR